MKAVSEAIRYGYNEKELFILSMGSGIFNNFQILDIYSYKAFCLHTQNGLGLSTKQR